MNTHKLVAVPGLALFLWTAQGQAALSSETIAERLQPVGQACIQGQECKGVATAATVAAGGGGSKTLDQIIAGHCSACHSTGVLGAPKIGDTAAWKARSDEQGGIDVLLKKAIAGFNAMPPRGTCTDCSDDELLATIKKMSGL